MSSFNADGRTFSKKQIVGYIFKELKRVSLQESERRQLVSQTVDGAVISVPAAFTLRELSFIRDAAQDSELKGGVGAELNVLGFIREPVAAAIAYFNAPNAEDEKTILVYDLGGGTCDVAIVRSSKHSKEWYKVIDSDMKRIGGRDWDKILIDLIKRKYREKSGFTVFDAEAENKIRQQAIKVKHELSMLPTSRASVTISGKTHSCIISIDEFENATSSLLQETMEIINKMMRKRDLNIDHIVCVGGSSNMPQVKKALSSNYPSIEIKLFEPEKAIAFGAAIYAEKLNEPQYLSDICKFSYGARYIDDYSIYQDENRYRITNIIFKGHSLPATGISRSKPMKDGQKSSYIAIYESECMDNKYMPEYGTYIGDICLTVSEGRMASDTTILDISIDQSGLMSLKATDEKTGKSESAEIQLKEF